MEAVANLKMIARHLTTKYRQTYYRTRRCIKSRIAITVEQSKHRYIQGSRMPTYNISVQRPQWENGAGINLFI